MSISPGTRLGRYEMQSLIGEGGMGQVYLAQDTQLDRIVALKILSAAVAADPQRLYRFLQEARAASKISGTNAAHIYEIGEASGHHFIAMEYVEGEQLAQRMAARRHTPAEIANIGAQIAEALDEAHARGVTHRDVKPQNVVITPRGQAKVLDFGLAKLTDEVPSEAATRVKTNPGTVMGTVSYMSPEQALGREDVDSRTDIFSLGVVLYEMAAGRLPFAGGSAPEIIDRIVHAQPEAIARFNYEVPAELDVIIKKALRKNREERYQTARDMLTDLRTLTRELGSGEHVTSSLSSQGTETPPMRQSASSAVYLVEGVKRHKRSAVVLLLAVTAAFGLALYKFAGQEKPARDVFQSVTVNRITTSGKAHDANISPDGKYVVYLEMADDGNRSLWVKQTETGNTLQIVPPTKGNVLKRTSFSPDGNFVYYLFSDRTQPLALYMVPSIGGTQKKLVVDIDNAYAVSPDGKRIAFVRWEDKKSNLRVANMDGAGERVIAALEKTEWFSDGGMAWSPDGKTIASAAGLVSAGGEEFRLVGVDVQTGAVRTLSQKRWARGGRVVWMPSGDALVLIAMDRIEEGRSQVWRVSHPSGEASRVTNDVQGRSLEILGVTADGRTLVTLTEQRLSRIEPVPASGDSGRAARLTADEANQEGMFGLSWTPDGRIVFSSFGGERSDLWIMKADGGGRQPLTADAYLDGYPSVSPDGRYVVFASNRPKGASATNLWRMDIDGSNLIQLTTGADYSPHVSPDGRWVVYTSWLTSEGQTSIWKVPIDGGQPVRLTDYHAGEPIYSPDGQWIACVAEDPTAPNRFIHAVIPASGGLPVRRFDFPGFQYQHVRWSPDGRDLSFIGRPPDPSNIWLQPVAGGEPRQLTDFKSNYIFRHAWSRDGRTLALVRGRGTSDVVLLRDEK